MMKSARTIIGLAAARRAAAAAVIAVGVGIAGQAGAGPLPTDPRALTAAAPLTYVQMGAERGLTKAQFIERRRQKATSEGQNPDQAAARAAQIFDLADTNHDGVLSRAEIDAFRAAHPGIGGGAAHAGGAAPPAH